MKTSQKEPVVVNYCYEKDNVARYKEYALRRTSVYGVQLCGRQPSEYGGGYDYIIKDYKDIMIMYHDLSILTANKEFSVTSVEPRMLPVYQICCESATCRCGYVCASYKDFNRALEAYKALLQRGYNAEFKLVRID